MRQVRGRLFPPGEARRGQVLSNAKLTKEGDALHVTTGPAVAYWNPSNTASGDYTVKATFTEAKYMNLNDHPHPYGVFIGGNDMGTPNESYLYCAAYGNGRFIVRGFGPDTVSQRPLQRSATCCSRPALVPAEVTNGPRTASLGRGAKPLSPH